VILGAVLVGGQSRRMGQPKSLIIVDGLPLVERLAQILDQVCHNVVAIGPAGLAASVPSIPDLYPGQGPLGAMITALTTLTNFDDQLLVIACDLVLLDTEALQLLIDGLRGDTDVATAVTDRPQPLCALWRAACLPVLEASFASGERSLLAAMRGLRVGEVAISADRLANVNTPDDLRQAQTWLA
jgi:molybdenum cofactor guanylyltransferase